VSRRTMITVGAILMILALMPFLVWPVYKYFSPTPVSAALFNRTKEAVEKHPELKPDWDAAMKDGVLTFPEAKAILEKAGEKAEPDE
jgi:hypothetical protein